MILDTSMLVVWLQVPGMEHCDSDGIGFSEVNQRLDEEAKKGTHFILPLAVLIETGNHITQVKTNNPKKREVARVFAEWVRTAIGGHSPWILFNDQLAIFDDEKLLEMIDEWRENLDSLSIGDISVKRVADHYASDRTEIIIFTCDQNLRAYSPTVDIPIPRRRR